MTNANANDIQEIEKQLQDLEHKRVVSRLETLVPRELFTNEQTGETDYKSYYNELYTLINYGYPQNKILTDDKLISIYGGYLHDLDLQRTEQQRLAEAKERTETAESLRREFPPTFKDKHGTYVFRT